jgi:hypothetical protein
MAIPKLPEGERDVDKPLPQEEQQPGSNATQHHPDPKAEPIPDGKETYHPRSPYTTGNY